MENKEKMTIAKYAKKMYNSFIIVYKAHVTVHSVHKTDIVASEQSNKYEFQSLFEKACF